MAKSIPKGALSSELLGKIAKISGQNVYQCMQCGTCTGVCPMALDMQISTRQAMLLLQHGWAEEVLDSKTPWLCASCHSCQVRCPRDIEIPRIMEALRQIQLRENVDYVNPRKISRKRIARVPQIALVAGFRKLTS